MIKSQIDIDYYNGKNKIYIPQSVYNSSFIYRYNNSYITIFTNRNCTSGYGTNNCDCYNYYLDKNVLSNVYSCYVYNYDSNIPFSALSTDINDSSYLTHSFFEDKCILLVMVILGILFAKFLLKERSHY